MVEDMKQLWKQVILEWQGRPLPEIFPREIDLSAYLNLGIKKIVVLTGFRRSGKTYLLFDLAKKLGKETTLYLNFEDERIVRDTTSLTQLSNTITEIYGKKKLALFLDEIQNMPNWSLWLRRLLDTTEYQIFITGSSSKLASAEIPTELRGRALSISVTPLNFREFLRFKRENWGTLTPSLRNNLLREFLLYGGFPEVALLDEGKKHLVLEDYYQTFIVRDVIERYRIRNQEALKTLVNLLLNSTYFTISKMTNNLKSLNFEAGRAAVVRYLEYLRSSYFCDYVYLHTPSVKKREKAEKKVYFVDNFLVTKYGGGFSQNMGRLMEAAVYRYLKQTVLGKPNVNIFYFKDHRAREADFVMRESEMVQEVVQVSYFEREEEAPKREIEGLLKALESFGLNHGSIVNWGVDKEMKIEGKSIKYLSLGKYLTTLT